MTPRPDQDLELRESEDLFRFLLENSHDLITLQDPEGRYVYASPGVSRLLGGDATQLGNVPPFDRVHPDDLEVAREAWQRTAAGQRVEFTCRFLHADGALRWLEIAASPVQYRGRPHVLGVTRDVTDRKRAEEERQLLEAQLQHAQKLESLGVLAGGIAHDFNNLLTGMLGYASLALMHLPAESPASPMLQEIEKAAQRAADLTQQMLAYSGKGQFVIQVLRLDTLVQEMTNLLGTVISKKAILRLDLEPATVEGDATQIRQVVMNLITNASDALEGENGVVTVRTSIRQADAAALRSPLFPEAPPGPYACVEVGDTGCGMSPETLARIFDPFFTTKFTGRGLGLAAVLGIVRGHGGALKVASTPGQGTLFQVFFPSVCAAPTEALSPARAAPRGQGTVLIVEDEEFVRTFARQALEGAGFHVVEACDGREGLELYRRLAQEIGLVLLDLTMPHVDGVEALRELRRLSPDVPVVVMSGYGEQNAAARFTDLRASGFIQKPFRPHELVTQVCQLLPAQAGGALVPDRRVE